MRRAASWVACALAVLGLARGDTHAATWTVDRLNPSCVDGGPGTEAIPFCSIQSGAAVAHPGDTVRVRPGTYREQVTPPRSGTIGAPIVFRAEGANTLVLGTLDVSDRFSWTRASGNVWQRFFGVVPRQVFVDGQRLDPAPSSDQTTDHSYVYDPDTSTLLVDLGGPNPGEGHIVEAGAFTYGFNLVGVSNIVVEGFTLSRQNSVGARTLDCSSITLRRLEVSLAATYGVRVEGAAGPVLVDSCEVSGAASNGILVLNATAVTMRGNVSHDNAFHGISLQGTRQSLVTGNTCYRNVCPTARAATGIDISAGSEHNSILANTTYENQDSGIQAYSNSDDNLIARNVSWANGDHGFDSKGVHGTRFVSNTAYGNVKDGFSIEDGTNISLRNNIGVDNGLGNHEFNLYVDELAVEGFSSDYDIFWNSIPVTVIQFDNVNFDSVEAFRLATGNEEHGRGVDPQFLDPSSLDFRLSRDSAGIDSADAGAEGFQLADHDGLMPADDPTVDNTGVGSPLFADRGAFENEPAPFVFLTVTPPSGAVDLAVQADASRSHTYAGGTVTSYRFDFGDGPAGDPQLSPIAEHVYTHPGIYIVTVYATDRLTSSASSPIVVFDRPPAVALSISPSPKNSRIITADASLSSDDDATPIASYLFDFGDGTAVGPQASPIATHTYRSRGFFRITVTVTDSAGLSANASALVNTKDRFSNLRIAGSAADQPPRTRSRRSRTRLR